MDSETMTAYATLVLAGITAYMAWATNKLANETKESLNEEKKQWRAEQDSNVVIRLVRRRDNSTIIDNYYFIVIENYGPQIAKNVKFKILTNVICTSMPLADVGIIKNGIPVFPPSRPEKILLNVQPTKSAYSNSVEIDYTWDTVINEKREGTFRGTYDDTLGNDFSAMNIW